MRADMSFLPSGWIYAIEDLRRVMEEMRGPSA
jgi:hypothetical protein